jgi:hypothetical protein
MQDSWNLRQHAANLSCVRYGFMQVEQAMYCLAWKRAVNPPPTSTVIYNAMGPDVSTLLLSTNATEIVAVEREQVHTSVLMRQLLACKEIIKNTGQRALSYPHSMIELLPADLRHDAKGGLLKRQEKGYWNINELIRYKLETCLFIELMMLDIDMNTVSVEEEGGKVSIAFDWNYPGETGANPRIIHYTMDSLYDLFGNKRKLYDGFYEKGRNWPNKSENINPPNIFSLLPIKPGGFVLVGRGQGDLFEEEALEIASRAALGPSFVNLVIPSYYQWLVYQKFLKTSMYGWDMWGAKKQQG